MLRSRTVHTIHELATQGKSIHEIARHLGLARNTVRKYLRGQVAAVARPKRPSKLDPFKDQIRQWVREDRLLNCETMFQRLQEQGYTGQRTVLRAFVRPLRPAKAGQRPVQRYETQPGEQLQFDWAEFQYEAAGVIRKLFGFTAVLSYSRMRFVTFVKRCDTPTLIRCLMAACEYFGGVPRTMLTDRMKSVLLEMDGRTPIWNPRFADFMAAIGAAPRVCKPYTPQTKGKVERSISVIKQSFWPGVRFTDLDDLNQQARRWCDERNRRVHRTTRQRPMERWAEEGLRPLPDAFAWERFGAEDRRVSWDGYLSYDGVLYGLPSEPLTAGTVVQVRERAGQLSVWSQGRLVLRCTKRPHSQDIVSHPDQFRTVVPAAQQRTDTTPLGHQIVAPTVARRSLAEYDQLYREAGAA
jgi:transposase